MSFFREKDIISLLKCPLCSEQLKDPRLLKCGETLCLDCIKKIYNCEKKGIQCPLCHEFETYESLANIAPNKFIARLLMKKSCEVSRGKAADDLKTKLDEIFLKINELKVDVKTDKSKIKEYCDFLFNNVTKVTDRTHSYLEKHRVEFMEQIDLYEKESQIQFDADAKEREKGGELDNKFVEEVYIFHDKWIDYLKKFIIDDVKLADAINEANDLLKRFEREIMRLKERDFKGNFLTFEKNPNIIDSSIIGKLSMEKCGYLNKKFEDLRKVTLVLKKYDTKKAALVAESINTGGLVFCYQNTELNLTLSLVSQKGEILQSVCIPLNSSRFFDLKLTKNQEALFIYVSYFNENEIGPKYFHILKTYDYDLNFLTETNIGQSITCLTAFDDRIFCLTNQLFKFNKVFAYDSKKLSYIETKGQESKHEPFYFSIDIEKLEVSKEFYFLLAKKKISIMNRSNGIIFRTYDFIADDFKMFFIYVIGFDELNKKLCYYDIDGYCIYKTIVNVSERVKLLTDGQGDISFFDLSSLSLWFGNN